MSRPISSPASTTRRHLDASRIEAVRCRGDSPSGHNVRQAVTIQAGDVADRLKIRWTNRLRTARDRDLWRE
jgi:hypothetical protein